MPNSSCVESRNAAPHSHKYLFYISDCDFMECEVYVKSAAKTMYISMLEQNAIIVMKYT